MPGRYGAIPGASGVRFLQPVGDARRMAITGSFCGWSQEGLELTLEPEGRFFELVLPLAPPWVVTYFLMGSYTQVKFNCHIKSVVLSMSFIYICLYSLPMLTDN